MFKRKKDDIVNHPECDHHWVHNAGEQFRWDIAGTRKGYKGDSLRIAFIYTCTMCGESFWSGRREFDIPHYRVKEGRKKRNVR